MICGALQASSAHMRGPALPRHRISVCNLAQRDPAPSIQITDSTHKHEVARSDTNASYERKSTDRGTHKGAQVMSDPDCSGASLEQVM